MVAFLKLLLKQGLMGPPIRILIDETSSIRLVIPHQVVMQPLSLHRSIGSAVWTADARPYKPAHPFSDDTKRCIRRTTTDCRGCRSSLLEYRFGSSGSSGFVVSFRCLRWFSCGPVPGVRSCRDRYRYRYICRPVGFLAVNGCRPKRIRLPLRGCLRSRSRVRAFHSHSTSEL